MTAPNVNYPERRTQSKVIKFFQEELHYRYLGNLANEENYNIRENDLEAFLIKRKHYSKRVACTAISDLKREAIDMQQGLYTANKNVYNHMLRYPHVVQDENGDNISVRYIDFENPQNNEFAIAEEVTVNFNYNNCNTKRPDLVIYINGIAVAVIELKKSSVSVAEGIRQNLTNQLPGFIPAFFTTIQFCLAGNESEGLRYGTIENPETKYLEWKQEAFRERMDELDENDLLVEEKCKGFTDGKLFEGLYSIFNKVRFLDLIYNFIIFDKGKKKVCRYNQYYAIHRAFNRVNKGKGGIVWHTQGSGKSLTMVWLSKKLLNGFANRRILIVTDREELDDQIEKLYLGVEERIIRTKSCNDLINKLNSHEGTLICTLVHKFGRHEGELDDKDYDKFAEELDKSLPEGFSAKGDFIVFVDECHRTQSGKLHKAMKKLLPNAIFIGFTGTPLLKADKQTSIEVFGNYIHTYKFDEGVRDHVILDLLYEGRDIPQEIMSKEKIDEWFELKTCGLTEIAKNELKRRWANIQELYSSRNRLSIIARDIIFDFEKDSRLKEGRGNAILVAYDILTACKYFDIFQQMGFKKCAIISSYTPQAGSLRTDTVSTDENTDAFEKYQIYRKMVGISEGEETGSIYKKIEGFEKEAKRKFVDEPANMNLLIVVDKLLTGFDAPPCTYLYIDKPMQNHGLFQAICRVNRLDDETKKFGVIIDYRKLFDNVADSMNKYTAGAFEEYDESDVTGLIKNRATETAKLFDKTLEELDILCEDVKPPKDMEEYRHFFCGINLDPLKNIDEAEAYSRLRKKFYILVGRLANSLANLRSQYTSYNYTEAEWAEKDTLTKKYIEIRNDIRLASSDHIDLKAYEPGMRHLIDTYIAAKDSKKLIEMDDITLLDIIEYYRDELTTGKKKIRQSAAEKIENNIRRKIVDQIDINPEYYKRLSAILDELIKKREMETIEYSELLNRYIQLAKEVEQSDTDSKYPESIAQSKAKRALYDNYGKDEALTNQLYEAIIDNIQEGFRHNDAKSKRIKGALYNILQDDSKVDEMFDLICKQDEF